MRVFFICDWCSICLGFTRSFQATFWRCGVFCPSIKIYSSCSVFGETEGSCLKFWHLHEVHIYLCCQACVFFGVVKSFRISSLVSEVLKNVVEQSTLHPRVLVCHLKSALPSSFRWKEALCFDPFESRSQHLVSIVLDIVCHDWKVLLLV